MAVAASKLEEQVPAQPQPQTTVTAWGSTWISNVKVATPQGFIALRIVQLIVALAILGLTSYLLSKDYGVSVPAESLTMFVAVATIVYEIYYIAAETIAPAVYNYIAILTCDSLLAIFWLSAMADSAALRAAFDIPIYTYYYKYKKRDVVTDFLNLLHTYLNVLTADACLGALEFVLFVISLIMFGVAVHRHLTATNPSHTVTEVGNQQPVDSSPPYNHYQPTNNPIS